MSAKKTWTHLFLVVCLTLGWAVSLPGGAPLAALADEPPPPAEEGGWAAPEEPAAPPSPSQEEMDMLYALDALETARRQGPEAVVALRDVLRGQPLDLVSDEIRQAQEQLAEAAPPLPQSLPVSLEQEEAAVQAQLAVDEALRSLPLPDASGLDETTLPVPELQPAEVPGAPAVDRTVGSPPCSYATVGAAIAAATSGDRLLLEGGVTFKVNLSVSKSLVFQGGYNGCGSASTANTTLDGTGVDRVLYFQPDTSSTLLNLNIINGSSSGNGAGVFAGQNAQLKLTNVSIHDNTSLAYGGGMRLLGATATMTDTNIYRNTAQIGAGVNGAISGSYPPHLNLAFTSDLYDNHALTGSGLGGGVYLSDGTLTMAECSDIYSNDAIQGGGAYLITSTLTMTGECSEIELNTATGSGGGIYARNSTINLDDQAELTSNQAGYGPGSGSGGGAFLDDSILWGDKALITYNTADDFGGGVYAANGSLLDMDLGSYVCASPRCSTLIHNTATTMYGGGVYAAGSSEVDLQQVFVESNSAQYGGGIYALQSPVNLNSTLLARNDASGGLGDGLRLYTGSSLSGANNTLAHNNAGGMTTGSAISMSGATLNLSGSIVWGHTTSINLAGQTVTCSDIQGGYTGTGNINTNPLFVDPANSNFHLQSLSPVIDRCAAGTARDFDNEARPVTYIRPAIPHDMGADEASTRVGINGAACAYGRIQDAVDAASAGASIQVEADVFTETVAISGKNLTITGGYDATCTTSMAGATTVNGGGADSVFSITGGVVTLSRLRLTGGDSPTGGGVELLPGGSQVTLDNMEVFGNQANYGAGVYVDTGNVMTLTNSTVIHHNIATLNGGGARVWGRLVGNNAGSSITDNTAAQGGGVSLPGGTLSFSGSHIMGNTASAAAGLGGGIHVYSGGVITTTSGTNIGGNSAYNGAGIYADAARIYLDGLIHSNSAANFGGGVYLANGSHLTAVDAYIGFAAGGWGANTASSGAGLYLDSSTLDFDGNIYHNIASYRGAGIFATGSTLNLNGARVGEASPGYANELGAAGHEGAGLYLTGGTRAAIANTTISSNAFQTDGYTYGGGAFIGGGSVVTMTNSTIERHAAPSAGDGRGAGLYISGSMVTLDATRVLSNTAGMAGGGIRLFDTSALNILNGSELRSNHATNGEGGALAVSGLPDINISDSTLQGNSAGTHGGAVYVDAGTLDFTGWWNLSGNSAGGSGGAVAVLGTGNAGFNATTAGSSILENHSGGSGGALYLNNSTSLELYANHGYLLSLSGNSAGGNGGAALLDNGGVLDIYGRVVVTANRAPGGNGGAIYLSNGSRLWLDDYSIDAPEVRVNWAQSGGAIYAKNSPSVACDGAKIGYAPNGNYTTSGSGGAIYLDHSTFDADNCVFINNQATLNGGAIAALGSTLKIYASYDGGMLDAESLAGEAPFAPRALLATACNALLKQCSSFSGNLADSDLDTAGSGGAIYVEDSQLNVSYTYLYGNQAARGGAIYQAGAASKGQVANTLIYSNTVQLAFGAGIRKDAGVFTVTHTTLANNVGGSGFSGVATLVTNSIAWGNTSAGFSAVPGAAACNIDDGGSAGLIANPQFVAPGGGENYHLQAASPAIDACLAGSSWDLDNYPRPIGGGYDMGAYEYTRLHLYLPVLVRQ